MFYFDGELEWQESYCFKVCSGEMFLGIVCDDSVVLYFIDEKLYEIICFVEGKVVYQMYFEVGQLQEKRLELLYFGGS